MELWSAPALKFYKINTIVMVRSAIITRNCSFLHFVCVLQLKVTFCRPDRPWTTPASQELPRSLPGASQVPPRCLLDASQTPPRCPSDASQMLPRCLPDASTAKVPQPGFHSKDSTGRIPKPGFHSNDSAVRLPKP